MVTLQNVPLSGYSTMRLGGNTAYLSEIHQKSEVGEALQWAESQGVPVIMIGEGSNVVWRDEGFNGLVLVNKIMGFETFAEDNDNLYVTIGAGEHWDNVVKRIVELGFSGVEELSLIPGTAGATPIQNVGAYGREIKDTLVSVEAYDSRVKQLVTIPAADCQFAYRKSRFNTVDKGRFFVTAITLHVIRKNPEPPFYQSVASYFETHGISQFTPQVLRDAVIAIRSAKLPDPAKVANTGSFFWNPIVSEEQHHKLLEQYNNLVYWPLDDGQVKLSAAWLVEQAGFKDVHDAETGMATWPTQTLVLVNEKASSTIALLQFKQKIIDAVKQKFEVTLEQEPEIMP